MAITKKAMLAAVLRAQGEDAQSLQYLIDRGAWSLEGFMGRQMMAAIEAGACVLGEDSAHDYWGNRIPSRTEVLEGTKGSVTYAYKALRDRGEW